MFSSMDWMLGGLKAKGEVGEYRTFIKFWYLIAQGH